MQLSYTPACSQPVAAGLAIAVGLRRLKERKADLRADFGDAWGTLLRDAQINVRAVPADEGRYPRISVTAPARVFADVMILAEELQQSERMVRELALEVGARDVFDEAVQVVEDARERPTVRDVAVGLGLDGDDWSE